MIRSDTIHWHAHVSGSSDPIGQESIKNELHVHVLPNQETYDLINSSNGIIDDHIYIVDDVDNAGSINVSPDNNSKLYMLGVPDSDISGQIINYNSNVYIQNSTNGNF